MLANRVLMLMAGMAFAMSLGCAKKEEPSKKEELPKATIHAGSTNPKSETKEVDPRAADLLKSKPDFTLSADQWLKEWKENPDESKKRYSGKIIELDGTVRSLSEDPHGKVKYLYLAGSGLGVMTAIGDKEPWLKTGPGCKVRVRGTTMEIRPSALYPCIIVESSPSTVAVVSAQQLATEFANDPKAAKDKYDGKPVAVDGSITMKEVGKDKSGKLVFKAESGIHIVSLLNLRLDFQKKGYDAALVGQYVKSYGEVSISTDGKTVTIHCEILHIPEK